MDAASNLDERRGLTPVDRQASDMKGKSLNKTASNTVQSADHITAVGTAIVRYGLVVVIAYIGLMKFTGSEAKRIHPFISHSPFMSWLDGILTIREQSDVIGTIEILAAVLIVLNVVSPRLGAVGGGAFAVRGMLLRGVRGDLQDLICVP